MANGSIIMVEDIYRVQRERAGRLADGLTWGARSAHAGVGEPAHPAGVLPLCAAGLERPCSADGLRRNRRVFGSWC
jgi:hypothetical protein